MAVVSERPAVGGVILAAGGGSRFADPTHKLLTEVDGRPLVSRALAAMVGAGLPELAIVTGAADLSGLVPVGVTELVNPDWPRGQATSLAVAVAWARDRHLDAIVVGLGDQPGVVSEAWRAVAGVVSEAWRAVAGGVSEAGRGVAGVEPEMAPIVVATYGGRRGHPVRLDRSVWERLPVSGDRGAGVLMARFPELVAEVACDGDATDVDTVEDLDRWR
ncbi:MAG: nucleotidyltransferase family protein [Acidimicrobiales bacterium]